MLSYKFILNKTSKSSDRYTLIDSPMGCDGHPDFYPTNKFCIVNGTDRGNGYQGYMSIDSFFRSSYIPFETKSVLFYKLLELGYVQYLKHLLGDDFNLYPGV